MNLYCHFRTCWAKCRATIFEVTGFAFCKTNFFEKKISNDWHVKSIVVWCKWNEHFPFTSLLCVQLEAMAILISGWSVLEAFYLGYLWRGSCCWNLSWLFVLGLSWSELTHKLTVSIIWSLAIKPKNDLSLFTFSLFITLWCFCLNWMQILTVVESSTFDIELWHHCISAE